MDLRHPAGSRDLLPAAPTDVVGLGTRTRQLVAANGELAARIATLERMRVELVDRAGRRAGAGAGASSGAFLA